LHTIEQFRKWDERESLKVGDTFPSGQQSRRYLRPLFWLVSSEALALLPQSWSRIAERTVVDVNCSAVTNFTNYGDGPKIVLTSQADADAWSVCRNFSGTVQIQSDNLTSITLTGFEYIRQGVMIANCSQLAEYSAPDLKEQAHLSLSNLPLLTSISLPALSTAGAFIGTPYRY
jgi:hypothetical protein